MDTHEYQAKEVLSRYQIPCPPHAVISSPQEIDAAINQLGIDRGVVKVQIHAGGRGKAGGVKIAHSKEAIQMYCRELLGMRIINNQTGPKGIVANKIIISPLAFFKKEYYVAVIIDRSLGKPVLILSPEGGMDIEEISLRFPDKIDKIPIGNDGSIRNYHLLRATKFMGWQGEVAKQGKKILMALGKAFMETDASLLEINPLVLTNDDTLLALDAKLSLDENALYRHRDLEAFYDATQLPKAEAQAKIYDLAYITLEGTIGCMVNGAGLAMATMDIIHHFGGHPANFLDVGGGASQEKIAEGFKIVLSDPRVESILVNIFGGIMNCVTLAAGIVSAASEQDIQVPVIVRMEGTNVEQGRNILKDSGLNITIADTLEDAAQKAVSATKSQGE